MPRVFIEKKGIWVNFPDDWTEDRISTAIGRIMSGPIEPVAKPESTPSTLPTTPSPTPQPWLDRINLGAGEEGLYGNLPSFEDIERITGYNPARMVRSDIRTLQAMGSDALRGLTQGAAAALSGVYSAAASPIEWLLEGIEQATRPHEGKPESLAHKIVAAPLRGAALQREVLSRIAALPGPAQQMIENTGRMLGSLAYVGPSVAAGRAAMAMLPDAVARPFLRKLGAGLVGATIASKLDVTDEYFPETAAAFMLFEAAPNIGRTAAKIGRKSFEIATKRTIEETSAPRDIFVSAEKVKDIFQTGEKISKEEAEMVRALGLKANQYRAAIQRGLHIRIPAETILTYGDRPWVQAVKRAFGMEPYIEVRRIGEAPTFEYGPKVVRPKTRKEVVLDEGEVQGRTERGPEVVPDEPSGISPRALVKSTEESVEIPLKKLDMPSWDESPSSIRSRQYIEEAMEGKREPREPILVRPIAGGRYKVIDGRSTVVALTRMGHEKVPAIVRTYDAISDDEIEMARSLYEQASETQKILDEIGSYISSRVNGKWKGTVKSMKSLLDKVQRKREAGIDYDIYSPKDHTRGSIIMRSWEDAPAVVDYLLNNGFVIENTLDEPLNEFGYRGINSYRNIKGRINGEIQIHTPESWELKKKSDEIYRKWRNEKIWAENKESFASDINRSRKAWEDYVRSIPREIRSAISSRLSGLASMISPPRTGRPMSTQESPFNTTTPGSFDESLNISPVSSLPSRGSIPETPTPSISEPPAKVKRSADTMSEAIAISSPSGRMSKAARKRAVARLSKELFGEGGLQPPEPEQPTKAESLRRQARELRELAKRGMKPRAYLMKAQELEAKADFLEQSGIKSDPEPSSASLFEGSSAGDEAASALGEIPGENRETQEGKTLDGLSPREQQAEIERRARDNHKVTLSFLDTGALEDLGRTILRGIDSKLKDILHNLGIKDRHDGIVLKSKDYVDIYKYLQMPYDVALSHPEFAPIYETQRDREIMKAIMDHAFARKTEPYFTLSDADRSLVDKALVQGDKMRSVYSPDDLRRLFSLNDTQIAGYNAIREALDDAREVLLTEMEVAGVQSEKIDEFRQSLKGYVPHKWYGNWAIIVRKRGKKKTVFMTKTTYIDRFRERDRLQKMYPNHDVIVMKSNKVPYEAYQDAPPWAVSRMVDLIIEKAQASSAVGEDLKQALSDMYKSKGFGAHFIRRKNVPGWSEDLARPLAEYFSGMNGYITKMRAIKQFSEDIKAIDPQKKPNLYRYALDYIRYVTGEQFEFGPAKQLAYVYYLYGNIKSAALNLTQNLLLGWPVLSKYARLSLPIMTQAQIRAANDRWLSDNERRFLSDLETEGYLDPKLAVEMSAFTKNPMIRIPQRAQRMGDMIDVFQHTEQWNRRAMAVALYDAGITDTYTAGRIIDEAHFRYSKGNRPVLMRGIASPLMTFRSWAINYITWLKNEIKAGRISTTARSLFALLLLGGLAGMPFYNVVKRAWIKAFGVDPQTEVTRHLGRSLATLLFRGLPSKLGISFTGSVGLGDILPTDLQSVGGVFADVPDRIIRVGKDLSAKNYVRALEDASPEAIRQPMAAWRSYTEGEYTRSGAPIYDPTTGEQQQLTLPEAIIKSLGFQPLRSAERAELQEVIEQIQESRTARKQEWANRYMVARNKGDKAAMAKVLREIKEYNARMLAEGRPEDAITRDEIVAAITARKKAGVPPKYLRPKWRQLLEGRQMLPTARSPVEKK